MAKIRHGRYPIYDLTKTSTAYLRPSPVAAGKVALNMFRAFVDVWAAVTAKNTNVSNNLESIETA